MNSIKPGGGFDPDKLKKTIADLEQSTGEPDFWKNREKAESVSSQMKQQSRRLALWETLFKEYQELTDLVELAVSEDELSLELEIRDLFSKIESRFEEARIVE